ncbi:beta-lactamase domain-containing protein [Oceanimonas sp. GK1]|uniref:MBL fold metallo-hydrolase RNA specificity domain-containing protein n=1 Tax=Oceanimonas sp. (strain GK1 / IBRC-M 10197) TaxID=511062 RepID=UPI0002494B0F|nr:MBL fold metallo-hydrolase [Oceanimonas sp. GK1]AEX99993.1 beta-lactamase domain-containing protein [Oceanimonas sp. GK1]
MKITFLGATQTVTGSKFLVSHNHRQILVDCGLYQGYKWLRQRNWQPLPLELDQLDAIVLTHAHLDHSGYIPVLYKQGYRGPVYCHPATRDLCEILLSDSGHLQEEDAVYLARHQLSKHEKPEPLYDRRTAENSMKLFRPLEFDQPKAVGDMRFWLQPAGHILGAGSLILECDGKKVGFSGDVGRPNDVFMRPPRPLPALDLLLLESTYGDRRHEPGDPLEQLATLVNDTVAAGGVMLIPSFAVGRAQTLQHLLVRLMDEQRIPKLKVFLDSPMAIEVSEIYERFVDQHRLSRADCHRMGQVITLVRSVEDSKALADEVYPHIIIAGSGMVTGGRILHHMKRLLGDHRTTLLLTGHQAGGTRGAKLLQGCDKVRIHGDWFDNRARIERLHGLSGHADYAELGQWLAASALEKGTAIELIHGEPEALEAMRDYLRQTTEFDVNIGEYERILTL